VEAPRSPEPDELWGEAQKWITRHEGLISYAALFSDTPKDIVEVERPESDLTLVKSSVPPPSPRKPRKT